MTHVPKILGIALTHACIFAAAARADSTPAPKLTLSSGEQVVGELQGVSNERLTLDDPKNSFAQGEWLRWSHPVAPPGRPRVHLSGSTWLVAKEDWTGKVPIRFTGASIAVENEFLGPVGFDSQQIDCILLEAAKEPAVARRLLAEAREPDAQSDRVWLVEGDLLSGEILGFDGTNLGFRLGEKKVPILASRVAAIAFARPAEPSQEAPKSNYLVGLSDGSLIEAMDFEAGSDQLRLTTPHGLQWEGDRKDALTFVQSLAPEIVYLSDLQPAEYRHTPYFDAAWPLAHDRNLQGEPLMASGCRYAKGLAMHSAARAVYRLPKGATRFCAEVAIDDAAKGRGSVVFRVYLFGNGNGREGGLTSVYESPVVRGGEKPRSVRIDVAGAQAVVLIVDYADFGDELDHANWLDARFVR